MNNTEFNDIVRTQLEVGCPAFQLPGDWCLMRSFGKGTQIPIKEKLASVERFLGSLAGRQYENVTVASLLNVAVDVTPYVERSFIGITFFCQICDFISETCGGFRPVRVRVAKDERVPWGGGWTAVEYWAFVPAELSISGEIETCMDDNSLIVPPITIFKTPGFFLNTRGAFKKWLESKWREGTRGRKQKKSRRV